MLREIEKEFNEAVEIRQELNNVLWRDFRDLADVFGALFGESPSLLKRLSDFNYYRGGYPSENSPSRLTSFFGSAARVAKYFALVGRLDEVNEHFSQFGLRIETIFEQPVTVNLDGLNESKRASKALTRLADKYGKLDTSDPAALVEWFLERTKNLQGVICERADEIKVNIFERVTVINSDIDKGGFMGAVNRYAAKKTKEERGKDVDALVEKAIEKADALRANGELLEEAVTR